MAVDALAGWLYEFNIRGEDYPAPIDVRCINVNDYYDDYKDAFINVITVDVEEYVKRYFYEPINTNKEAYVFPAVFDVADDGISIEFPDLPGCLPCADTLDEAINKAKQALMLHLYGMEEDNEKIPEPTPFSRIKTESNQSLMLIDVFMPPFREKQHKKHM